MLVCLLSYHHILLLVTVTVFPSPLPNPCQEMGTLSKQSQWTTFTFPLEPKMENCQVTSKVASQEDSSSVLSPKITEAVDSPSLLAQRSLCLQEQSCDFPRSLPHLILHSFIFSSVSQLLLVHKGWEGKPHFFHLTILTAFLARLAL